MPLATQQTTGGSVNATETIHQLVNVSKEAETSISPVLIVPVLTNDGRYFKVKTLLDSGSTTNWITRKVLHKVKHKIKGNKTLAVFTFGGQIKKSFPLAEIYTHDDKSKVNKIMCYVQDEYTEHVTVDNICSYIDFNHTTPYKLSKPIVNPSSVEVDHTDAPNSIGMIFCSSTINTLRTDEPITLLPELKILLEPTVFGTAISGSVPQCLKSQDHLASKHNVAVMSVSEVSDPNLCITKNDVAETHTNFTCKQEKLDIGPKEQFPFDKKQKSLRWSASTSYTSLCQVLYYCMILLLQLAVARYVFTSIDCADTSIQQALHPNIYADPVHSLIDYKKTMAFLGTSPTARGRPARIHMPYERVESVSLAQNKVSRIVLRHFRRKIIHSYFPTCIQVKSKFHTINTPSNHSFSLRLNYEHFTHFIITIFHLIFSCCLLNSLLLPHLHSGKE